jgi:hypothetical protein
MIVNLRKTFMMLFLYIIDMKEKNGIEFQGIIK